MSVERLNDVGVTCPDSRLVTDISQVVSQAATEGARAKDEHSLVSDRRNGKLTLEGGRSGERWLLIAAYWSHWFEWHLRGV